MNACLNLGLMDFGKDFMDPMKSILLFNLPLCFLYFLYFKSIVNDYTIFNKKFLLHFILPTSFITYVIIMYILGLNDKYYFRIINFIFLIALSVYYNVQSFFLLKNSFWNVPDKEQSIHYKFIRRWSLSIYSVSLIWVIGFFTSLFLDFISIENIKEGNFLIIHSFVWLVIFVNIIMYPQILLGLPNFREKLNPISSNSLEVPQYWKIDKELISNQKDTKLEEKIDAKILNLIKEVELLSVKQHFFRNQKITIADFARTIFLVLA